MKTLKEKIDIMQAALDGESVEEQLVSTLDSRRWLSLEPVIDRNYMTFDWVKYDYRIKPEPLEFYVSVTGDTPSCVNTSKGYVEEIVDNDPEWRIIKVREVVE